MWKLGSASACILRLKRNARMIAALLRMFMSFLYIINNIKFQVGKAKFQVSSFKNYALLGGYIMRWIRVIFFVRCKCRETFRYVLADM